MELTEQERLLERIRTEALRQDKSEIFHEVEALFQSALVGSESAITVRAFADRALGSIVNAKTKKTYKTHIRRLVEVGPCRNPAADGSPADPAVCKELGCLHRPAGDMKLHEVTRGHLEDLGIWVLRRAQEEQRLRIARKRLALRQQTNPDLVLADIVVPDDDLAPTAGNHALETYVNAMSMFFRYAVSELLIKLNPAAGLDEIKRKRGQSKQVPLLDYQIDQVFQIASLDCTDPELWELVIWFHLETGGRMSCAIKLAIEDIDPERQTVRIGKKGEHEWEQPVSATLIDALLTHAISRGAEHDYERVFRHVTGQTIVGLAEHHYHRFWERVRTHADWAARHGTATHSLRKTTSTLIERLCGEYVSEAWLGHRRSNGSNTPYMRASIGEVALVVEMLTGEFHPLADESAPWLPSDYQRPEPA